MPLSRASPEPEALGGKEGSHRRPGLAEGAQEAAGGELQAGGGRFGLK